MKLLASVLFAAASLLAQDKPPLRVSVTFVQVDAVVTDSNGKQVSNLTKDDFEVFEDGKHHTVSTLSYVSTGAPGSVLHETGRGSPATVRLQREMVRRTIALVVDDLKKMSFESVNHTRTALRKFVEEQMMTGDLVAVISTSGA